MTVATKAQSVVIVGDLPIDDEDVHAVQDGDTKDDTASFDGDSACESFLPPELLDHAIGGYEEHIADVKQRVTVPGLATNMLHTRVISENSLFANLPLAVRPIACEHVEEVGDIRHDIADNMKSPLPIREDALRECSPTRFTAVPIMRPALCEVTVNVSVLNTEAVRDVRLEKQSPCMVRPEPEVPFVPDLPRTSGMQNIVSDLKNSLVLRVRERTPLNNGSSIVTNSSSEQTDEAPKDPNSKLGNWNTAEVEKHVPNSQTRTDHVLNVCESTQPGLLQTGIGFQELLSASVGVVFFVIYAYLCFVLALYTKDFYEREFQDVLEFL